MFILYNVWEMSFGEKYVSVGDKFTQSQHSDIKAMYHHRDHGMYLKKNYIMN